MKIKDLIHILEGYDPNLEIIVATSSTTWDNVLVIMDKPSSPDDCSEIHL